MLRNRVRAGSVYVFNPVFGDVIDARTDLKKGEVVRVVNLPGAPKCNTMGMAHVERLDGRFAGLVYTNSLQAALIDNAGRVHLREQRIK